MDLFLYDKDLRLERVKVNKSVYIAQSRPRHDITLNKFYKICKRGVNRFH